MTRKNENAVRNRTWCYLSCDVAASAGLSLGELQQVLLGHLPLADDQLQALGRAHGV